MMFRPNNKLLTPPVNISSEISHEIGNVERVGAEDRIRIHTGFIQTVFKFPAVGSRGFVTVLRSTVSHSHVNLFKAV